MQPEWLVRAEAEQKELRERLKVLNSILWGGGGNGRKGIAHIDVCDLLDQSRAMEIYNSILSRRIKRNGGMVCE